MKKTNTKKTNWYDGVELNDEVLITGFTKKIVHEGEKVNKWCVEVARKTPNNKIARAWLTVVDFDDQLEEGKVYDMSCQITTGSYKNKKGETVFTGTEFIVNEVNEI